jgi:class 3 adenylate cyclase
MARTQAVTILFCDLVSSTERRARLGDDAFDEFTQRFLGALRTAVRDNGGREVSSAGDGLMVVFPESVIGALSCAATMHRSMAALDRSDPPRLRIGISTGEVAEDGDGYSGMPIVEAARLEAVARPGSTYANAIVRSLVGSRGGFRFRDVGALTLKGLPAPLASVEVVDAVDPVGRVGAAEAPPVPTPASRSDAHRRARRRWALATGAVAVVGVVVAVAIAVTTDTSGKSGVTAGGPTSVGVSRPPNYTPHFERVTCPGDIPAAGAHASCGRLVVPENRRDPHGKHVSLTVVRAPPRTHARPSDPTIDLCGCENAANSLTRDHAELIQLSARGFHGSDPMLTCPEMSSERVAAFVVRANDAAEVARGTAALAKCHARLVGAGIDPAQYNYKVAALDALDLMYVLGIHRADFTASDLVSAEVFEILRIAPQVVRSIMIENPAAPGSTELSQPVSDLAGAFDRFTAQCARDRTCARSYHDLGSDWRATYARYEAHPALVTATDSEDPSALTEKVLLDGPRVADTLAAALADPSTYQLIPAAITEANTDALTASVYVRSDFFSFHADAPWGTLASYLCAYDVHTEDPNASALERQTTPQFTRAWTSHWQQWCKAWKVPDVSPELSEDLVSPVPAFFFRGELTAFGNDEWLRQIEHGMSHAQAVVFPTLGGGLLTTGPQCLSELRRAFLTHPTAKLDTDACAKQSPPIDFVARG